MSMDMQTPGMDRQTSEAAQRPAPNQVLISLRKDRGWGRPRLAKEFDDICRRNGWSSPGCPAMEKQIYRLETGRVRSPDDLYMRLYCTAYGKTAQELFGELNARPEQTARVCRLRSHKFIPAYIGAEHAARLCHQQSLSGCTDQWLECLAAPVDHSDGTCSMYVWPFGVAMYHLVEDLALESVAELSVWRRMSYRDNMKWATDQMRSLTGAENVAAPYVLSAYWVDEPAWSGDELLTALRLLCIPRVLIERDPRDGVPSLAHAELVERALLHDGFDHPELVDFGMKGISLGLASWSGVVYHPIAPERALSESDLVRCELATQAVWTYCDHIRRQVEDGVDPVVPVDYGWRFLRGIRSRLTTERPQETSQHRSMREAVVETSGLLRRLTQAVETLRESDGGRA